MGPCSPSRNVWLSVWHSALPGLSLWEGLNMQFSNFSTQVHGIHVHTGES
jgi:hypothetical protein